MYINQLKKSISEGFVTYILIQGGYQILARNFTFRGGELDIIAKKGVKLIVVEVKCHKYEDIPFTNQQLFRILVGLRFFIYKKHVYTKQIEVWGAICKIRRSNLYVKFLRLR